MLYRKSLIGKLKKVVSHNGLLPFFIYTKLKMVLGLLTLTLKCVLLPIKFYSVGVVVLPCFFSPEFHSGLSMV